MAKLDIKESMRVEFKSDLKSLPDNEIIDALVAFSNSGGGDLYLGVEDDGEITGLSKEHRDIARLSAFIANKTVPPIASRVDYVDGEKPYLVISVPSSPTVVSNSNGRITRRRLKGDGSPENVPMYPYEISSRLSYLSLLDYSALIVHEGSLDDLDPVERERARRLVALNGGDNALLGLDDHDFDLALGFIKKEGESFLPTYGGLLLIGKESSLKRIMPTAEISVQVMEGTSVRVNENLYLPILAAFEKLISIYEGENRSREFFIDEVRIDVPEIDRRAYREAIVNAFAHRDYTALGRIRVAFSEEGVTITSPGGFMEGVDQRFLVDSEPKGRNRALSDALKRLGLGERTGRGIDRIYEGSLRYGKTLPDYSGSNETMVRLFISKGEADLPFASFLKREEKRLARPFSLYSLFILDHLRRFPGGGKEEILSSLPLEKGRVSSSLDSLVRDGSIIEEGKGYSLPYEAKPSRDEEDLDEAMEKILLEAKRKGSINRAEAEKASGLNSSKAYRLLKKLADKGELFLEGSGKGARYFVKK